MFKHLILISSLLFAVSCSENYSESAVADNSTATRIDNFKLASVGSVVLVDAAPENEFTFVRSESIGGLKLEMTPKQFTPLLPCSVEKGEPTLWAGIGEIIQEWNYSDCGIKLQLSSPDNDTPQTISSIKVTAPSEFKTSRGITLGSDFSQVLQAYSEFADEADNQTGETFMAGSIYGGLIMQLEDGLVTSLFLGAGAE